MGSPGGSNVGTFTDGGVLEMSERLASGPSGRVIPNLQITRCFCRIVPMSFPLSSVFRKAVCSVLERWGEGKRNPQTEKRRAVMVMWGIHPTCIKGRFVKSGSPAHQPPWIQYGGTSRLSATCRISSSRFLAMACHKYVALASILLLRLDEKRGRIFPQSQQRCLCCRCADREIRESARLRHHPEMRSV